MDAVADTLTRRGLVARAGALGVGALVAQAMPIAHAPRRGAAARPRRRAIRTRRGVALLLGRAGA